MPWLFFDAKCYIFKNPYSVYKKRRLNMGNDRKLQYVDMKYFLEYANVRNNIVYKLIHTERNRELLEDIPYIEFLDLSIVFQYLISKKESHLETLLIHNVHTKLWGVTVEELCHMVYKIAICIIVMWVICGICDLSIVYHISESSYDSHCLFFPA